MVLKSHRRRWPYAAAAAIVCGATATALTLGSSTAGATPTATVNPESATTATPIKHVVVLFDENVSFDHYFGTYPKAANDGTGPSFTAAAGTPSANNYQTHPNLLGNTNPNVGTGFYAPQRLTSDQAVTCSQGHGYSAEQKAYDGGLNDKFINTNNSTCNTTGAYIEPGEVMDYYDGNTVTAEWNYAQQFALSDNSFSSQFGPSTPGALNLISGQTHGFVTTSSAYAGSASTSTTVDPVPTGMTEGTAGDPTSATGTYTAVTSTGSTAADAHGVTTVSGDPDPAYDDCSSHTAASLAAAMNPTLANEIGQPSAPTNKNIGDLLNAKNISWGWFQGGFTPTAAATASTPAVCARTHVNVAGGSSTDYSPHHNPFAYYASTSNPHHLAPSLSEDQVGGADPAANHNYDLSYFNRALADGNLASVSFLKAAQFQDGHPGNSDPVDEQHFLVSEINAIQKSQFWKDTAIVIAYDDSDGWYDHVAATITNGSNDTTGFTGPAGDQSICTNAAATQAPAGGYVDRCGPGTRQPLLVISPYAKTNYIDHSVTTQASILKFVEDNWSAGQVGDNSYDATAGSLNGLFDFSKSNNKRVLLNADGTVQSISEIVSTPKPPVTKPSPKPVVPGKVKITGKAAVGHKLAAHASSWSPSGESFKYQWKANGKAIRKATKSTLTLTKSLKGKRITVTVTGSKSGWIARSKTSAATKKVAAK